MAKSQGMPNKKGTGKPITRPKPNVFTLVGNDDLRKQADKRP
jgi:hypothetical protein